MFKLLVTKEFKTWEENLKDIRARAALIRRLLALELGKFGDCKNLGGKLMELRLHIGPGYRVYFARQRDEIIILLAGGDKNGQQKDIQMARSILKRESHNAS